MEKLNLEIKEVMDKLDLEITDCQLLRNQKWDIIEKLLSRVEKLKSQYDNVKKRNNNMKKKIIELEKESELYKDYCRNITHVKWSD